MISRNEVRKASQVLMSLGVTALVFAAAICFTGYPPTVASAAPVGSGTGSTVDAVARFTAPRVAPKRQGPIRSKVARSKVAGTKVVKKKVAKKRIVPKTPWQTARVSWYGPGFYGNTMAGGGKLRRDSMVVAHKSMRFGTKIQFSYRGRTVVAVVRDRGPYVGGRQFDLGPGTKNRLGFSGVGNVRWRVVK